MSEYQYYEFRAVDHPLTRGQMEELRHYSSRARISSDSFVNEYNWGDFKGDPEKWMEQYFDAFLYLANWGTRTFMLRVPAQMLDLQTAGAYCESEAFSYRKTSGHLIFSFNSREEDSDWEDGEGWLGSLVQLRSDLMNGDYRCLYIGWLLAVQDAEFDDDTAEPPVPPGLGDLNAPLQSLAEFLRIDPDLIASAAEKSGKEHDRGPSSEEISGWVAQLPSKDKDAVLIRLLEGDDLRIVAAELKHRAMKDLRGGVKSGSGSQTSDRRTVGELLARCEIIGQEREKREAERAAREKARRERAEAEARKRHLEALCGKESALWTKVEELIAEKRAAPYDKAVLLLKDLHDLARMNGTVSEFSRRMSALCSEYGGRRALMDRFRKAGLLD